MYLLIFIECNRYMVQLLNLIVHNVGAPALHNSGFAVISYHLVCCVTNCVHPITIKFLQIYSSVFNI